MPLQAISQLHRAIGNAARMAIRLPGAGDAEVLTIATQVSADPVRRAEGSFPPLIHNRATLLDRLGDFGLWLPSSETMLAEVRVADPDRHLAVSVHSLERAQHAVADGADEIIFGHVFETESHPNQPGRGVEELVSIIRWMNQYAPGVLVTAIGGISAANAARIGATGCRSLAMIRAITRAPDPLGTIDAVINEWTRGRKTTHPISRTTRLE